MNQHSPVEHWWLGLCRKPPVFRTAPALIVFEPETAHPVQPGRSSPAGSSGQVRHGIGIATGSIRALFREKRLLWFSLFTGLAILFLFVAEGWSLTHSNGIPLPYSIWIPIGNSSLALFNLQLFLIEAISLSCFTCVLAGLVLYWNCAKKPVVIRDAFDRVNTHAGALAALSITMAVLATVVFEIISQSQFIGRIIFTLDMTLFNLPYAYYVPNGITAMYHFSFMIMAINSVLFLLALYVVPGIVLEKKRLLPALAGSVSLMKKTWRELLGCILVLGAIILGVGAAGLLIGQSPLLLNHDYDFFLQMSRGQVLMTAACYGFLFSCFLLMAAGYTAAGVAISDLYHVGKSDGLSALPEGSLKKPEPAS